MYTWQPCINECASGARFLINSSCTLSLRYQYSSELNLSLQAFFFLQKVFFFVFFTMKGKDLSRLSSTLAVEGFIPTCNGLSQALSLVLCKCPQLLVTSESILILWEHLDREGSDSKSNKLHEIIALHKDRVCYVGDCFFKFVTVLKPDTCLLSIILHLTKLCISLERRSKYLCICKYI